MSLWELTLSHSHSPRASSVLLQWCLGSGEPHPTPEALPPSPVQLDGPLLHHHSGMRGACLPQREIPRLREGTRTCAAPQPPDLLPRHLGADGSCPSEGLTGQVSTKQTQTLCKSQSSAHKMPSLECPAVTLTSDEPPWKRTDPQRTGSGPWSTDLSPVCFSPRGLLVPGSSVRVPCLPFAGSGLTILACGWPCLPKGSGDSSLSSSRPSWDPAFVLWGGGHEGGHPEYKAAEPSRRAHEGTSESAA